MITRRVPVMSPVPVSLIAASGYRRRPASIRQRKPHREPRSFADVAVDHDRSAHLLGEILHDCETDSGRPDPHLAYKISDPDGNEDWLCAHDVQKPGQNLAWP